MSRSCHLVEIGTFPQLLLDGILPFRLSSPCQFSATRPRRSSFGRRWLEHLSQFGGKLLQAILFVAKLSPMPRGPDAQKSIVAQPAPQPFDDSRALGFRKDLLLRTSKHNSTLVFSLFTFWPPGPGLRSKLNLSSDTGIVRRDVIAISSMRFWFDARSNGFEW